MIPYNSCCFGRLRPEKPCKSDDSVAPLQRSGDALSDRATSPPHGRPPASAGTSASEHPNHHAMALDLSDVKRIAHLARIETSDAEAEQTLAQLNNFFSLVEQMQAVDTTGIEPLAHPLSAVRDMVQRLRDDAVTENDRRDDYQRPAPATENGLYLVPKVIE